MYKLFELALLDPHAPAFVSGEAAIARAAGFRSPRHFATTYLSQASSSSVLAPGVLSEHAPHGHWYLVNGEPVTHPTSASVFGQRVREATAAGRRAGTPGWRGPGSEPANPAPSMHELPVAISLPLSIGPGEPFRLVGEPTAKPGSDPDSSA